MRYVSCHVILSARYRRVLRTDIKVIPHQHSLLNKLGQDGCTRTVRGGAIAARFGRFGILYSGCKAYSACDAVFGMLYSDTSACCMRTDTSILRSVLRTSLSGAYMPGVLSRYGRTLVLRSGRSCASREPLPVHLMRHQLWKPRTGYTTQ